MNAAVRTDGKNGLFAVSGRGAAAGHRGKTPAAV